jgi:large-conductance mechanosensitive channel
MRLRQEAAAGPKAEELLAEIRDLLKAKTESGPGAV